MGISENHSPQMQVRFFVRLYQNGGKYAGRWGAKALAGGFYRCSSPGRMLTAETAPVSPGTVSDKYSCKTGVNVRTVLTEYLERTENNGFNTDRKNTEGSPC